MTPAYRGPFNACLLVIVLAISLGTVSGQPAGDPAHELILDTLALIDQIEYSVDGPFKLDDLEKTVEMRVPALGEMADFTELLAQVVVSNGVPRGHMRAVVARLRDGRRKRLGSTIRRFGPTISDPPLGSALFFMPIDSGEIEAGDILTITFTFNTNGYQLRRGDEMFVSLQWEFASGTGAVPAGAERTAFAYAGLNPLDDKLSVASRLAGSQHAQLHELEAGTALSDVGIELELPIPDSLDGSFAEEMLVFVGAFAGSIGGDEPGGRIRFRLLRYPGDGGHRQLLLNRSVKQEEAVIQERVPTPEGFGVGDRIVAEIYFRTDWITPAGGGLVESMAQFVPIHDR